MAKCWLTRLEELRVSEETLARPRFRGSPSPTRGRSRTNQFSKTKRLSAKAEFAWIPSSFRCSLSKLSSRGAGFLVSAGSLVNHFFSVGALFCEERHPATATAFRGGASILLAALVQSSLFFDSNLLAAPLSDRLAHAVVGRTSRPPEALSCGCPIALGSRPSLARGDPERSSSLARGPAVERAADFSSAAVFVNPSFEGPLTFSSLAASRSVAGGRNLAGSFFWSTPLCWAASFGERPWGFAAPECVDRRDLPASGSARSSLPCGLERFRSAWVIEWTGYVAWVPARSAAASASCHRTSRATWRFLLVRTSATRPSPERNS